MSQPRNFLLPGENETMHQIMQEHYKKTGQLDKLDPLADPVDLDFDPTEPMGLGFMEMYPVHAVAVYMLSPGEQGEKHGVQKGWELLECWLEPKEPVTEIPDPPPPPPEDPEKEKNKLFDPWGGNYPRPPKRKEWTLKEVASIDGTKVVYDVNDVDKLMVAFKDAAKRGGVLTMKFRPEPKDENQFRSYATVGDPTAKKKKAAPKPELPAVATNPAQAALMAGGVVERE